MAPLTPTDAGIIGLAVAVFARELFSLIRWLVVRRNGGSSGGPPGCSAGVERALEKLVLIQKGQQRRLDSLDDAVRAIPTSNHQLVMEIVTVMRGVGAGGP